jgi:hypothetical protein
LPQELERSDERLHCTPRSSGSILPFNIPVRLGQTVNIAWDSELSRYIVWLEEKTAA